MQRHKKYSWHRNNIFYKKLALLLALGLGIYVTVNLFTVKISDVYLFSPSDFQIVINPIKSSEKILISDIDAHYYEDVNTCGSGGCAYAIKDKLGNELSSGLSLGKPIWVENRHDGKKDILIYQRTYPAVSYNGVPVVRTVVECFNQEIYTYSPDNCEASSFDSLFTGIEELSDLKLKLIGE